MSLPNDFYMTINVRELLKLIDYDKKAGKHASSVKAICMEEMQLRLQEKYMRECGEQVELLSMACTTKGRWLDAWYQWKRNGQTVMLQVEVKSWSMHGYGGGQAMHPDVWGDELSQYMKKEWHRTWDNKKQCFVAQGLDKVRLRMRTDHKGEVIPVACLWSAMHPEGDLFAPLFEVQTQGEFSKVMVFSVSAYLRQHLRTGKGDWVTLNLPKSAARLGMLSQIFGFTAPPKRVAGDNDLANAA